MENPKFLEINSNYNLTNITQIYKKKFGILDNISLNILKFNENETSIMDKLIKATEYIKHFVNSESCIFTDGSKSLTFNGVGIYYSDAGETFSLKFLNDLSIKFRSDCAEYRRKLRILSNSLGLYER